ncbi:hypothetical protein [Crateriforma conspicua]|uniref:Uncharacterized protein n=1 Tax=Crateriforma conspicua TaxID=2527996 RepID=A0A5C5Y1Q1_9PLAN|nr:hypothetical protein [Crateriforma conspicua]QDV62657.1 hypothetical protein Mal65_17920 [Crateriforma conspicua]TWT68573.1 hypothetical protein Pan14r_08190 [Crateriforma conspicua]
MKRFVRHTALLGFLLPLCLSASVVAQTSQSNSTGVRTGTTADGRQSVTLTRSVEPSFHIEPIVQRFEARRGAEIPFRFKITSTGKDMNVTVQAVRLRQEESGVILHDLQGGAPDEVDITSSTAFPLAPGESHVIQGTVKVPLAKTNFLSYGILVRDNGVANEFTGDADGQTTTAGVQFVTQYVLRIDIETGIKDLAAMNQLQLTEAHVASELGMPVATVYLDNPTDYAFEFKVRGNIGVAGRRPAAPFWLSMLSRASLEDESERTLIRVMPKSRLKLQAEVDSLDLQGDKVFRIAITNGRRELVVREFSLAAKTASFPALKAKLAHLGDGFSVSPSQIRLGQVAGVDRTAILRFENTGNTLQSARIRLRDLDGHPVTGVRVSSDDFQLKPGRTKSVRLSMQRSGDHTDAIFGVLDIVSESESGQASRRQLPVAMLFGDAPAADLQLGDLQLQQDGSRRYLSMTATNAGEGYLPVDARLTLASAAGWTLEMADGYGVWLKPGETKQLRFIPDRSLDDGQYQVDYMVRSTDDVPPTVRSLIVTLGQAGDESEPPQTAPSAEQTLTSANESPLADAR